MAENLSKKKRKKKTRSQKRAAAAAKNNSRERNKANDPLQNFDGDVNMDGLLAAGDGHGNDSRVGEAEGDKFFDEDESDEEENAKEMKNQAFLDDGEDGFGKSTAGRNAWKQKHNKGKFNRRLQKEKQEHLHKW